MFWKSFFKNRSLPSLSIPLVLGIAGISFARAGDDPEPPKPWPERILRSLHTEADRAYLGLSSAIFDNLDQILDVSPLSYPGGGTAGVELHREVFDNFDLLNTYTVVDHVKLKSDARPFAGLTTWTEDHETPSLGTPYVGLVFEPQSSIEWTDVRQVKAREYRSSPSLRETAAAALSESEPSSPGTRPSPLPLPSPDPDVSELNPGIGRAFLDPSIRARFSKALNLVTFPFRLPLHRADVRKMSDGEILSYAFDGRVEVGVSAGLKVIPTLNVLHAGLDLRGTVVLRGRYEISVLREDDRHARVKLTRLNERGTKLSVKLGIDRKAAFDGVILFKGSKIEADHVGKVDANFVPFNFESSRLRSDQFDVVYRYDLDDPRGRSAYHRAVLGKFADSQAVVEDSTIPGKKPVERLLSREGVRTEVERTTKAELAGVLNLDWNSKREALEATLELPDGTHHVLEAYRNREHRKKAFFGASSEKTTRRMTLYLDSELLERHDPESVFVIAEITEEDSNTKAKELNSAISRMEGFLRNPDLLPSVPDSIPGRRNPEKTRNAWYGRSSFYYGYSLSLEEVEAFLRTDRARVAEAAGRAFDQDEARRLMKAWDSASEALESNAPATDLFRALRGLFAGRFSVVPLTSVIFDCLPVRLIDYFVTAQNVAFGRVQERGKTVTPVEKALTNTDRELGFRNYAVRKQDSEAIVKDLSVSPGDGGRLLLRFTLSAEPTNVFFRLFQTSGLKRQKEIAEVVVSNRLGRFRRGENTLLLDPDSTDFLTAKLSRDLRSGPYYGLSVSFSRSPDHYGPVSSVRFEAGDSYPR